ncbi:solute carrier family 2, facilitated glucose transporter member 7 [Drosophila busckii]|uniref:solute carrier family 2, facilitated glucose transporter member 7 n=1 Tax=Drosophila busckii TaxID=30019 RepID=UPI00083F05F3|nr:solute carrier family 2, facilitated glucose transporter member 7 [Drosophila busckii]
MDPAQEGLSPFLIFLCIEITIGFVVPVGYCFGVLNAIQKVIKEWAKETASQRYSSSFGESELTLVFASVAAIFQIGGIIGSLLGPLCNKKLGRRNTLLLAALVYVISAISHFVCRYAMLLELLWLGRLLVGVAAGFVYTTQPTYLMEVAPPHLSGSVGVFTCIGIAFGIWMGQLFSFDFFWGTERYWHLAAAGYLIFVIIGILPMYWFPETPRMLIVNGKREEAKAALLRLRSNKDAVDKELASIEAAVKSAVEPVGMIELLRDKKFSISMLIVCGFHFVQQGSGIGPVWYYSVAIFLSAGFDLKTSLWLNFAEGGLGFVSSLILPCVIPKLDRRILMSVSCLVCCLVLTLLAFGLAFMSAAKWIAFACIIVFSLFIIAFNMGLGPIPYFIGAEISEVPPRASLMGWGGLTNCAVNFVMVLIFPLINDAIGPYAFLPLAAICPLGFLITLFFLPETRNKVPEEVAPLLQDGCKSKVWPKPKS